jgi:hypothetical protein
MNRVRWARVFLCLALIFPFAPRRVTEAGAETSAAQDSRSGSTDAAASNSVQAGLHYVGSEACASCHVDIYKSFRATAMGRSMVPGNDSSLAAVLPAPATVYDKDKHQYFQVARDGRDLFQSEYSLDDNGKELFRQTWKLDYVMGAGENGFGFLVQRDHYLFEAPLSYYSKTHSWSFSPGYEIRNRGFTRPILDRCIVCHSGRANPVVGQIGKYKDAAFDELAVGCENCHGPGEQHVAERTQEAFTGTALTEAADPTIVNPARLSGWAADNICMKCHQGQDVRVEMPGKHIQDFRPGMLLSNVVAILKIAPGPEARPSSLPLEHYFGMTLSKCYRASGNLHCVSCHDPHVQLSGTASTSYYRSRCLGCHSEQSCRLEMGKRRAMQPADDCLECHMPKRTVTRISHAALTDHSIPAKASAEEIIEPRGPQAADLLLLTESAGQWRNLHALPPITLLHAYDDLVREGHQEFYAPMLRTLKQVATQAPSDPAALRILAHASFSENTGAADAKALAYIKRVVSSSSSNIDDYFLLAQLYIRTRRDREAIPVLEKARTVSPYFREVYETLANEYMALGQYGDAMGVLKKGIALFPDDLTLRELEKKASSVMLGPAN